MRFCFNARKFFDECPEFLSNTSNVRRAKLESGTIGDQRREPICDVIVRKLSVPHDIQAVRISANKNTSIIIVFLVWDWDGK